MGFFPFVIIVLSIAVAYGVGAWYIQDLRTGAALTNERMDCIIAEANEARATCVRYRDDLAGMIIKWGNLHNDLVAQVGIENSKTAAQLKTVNERFLPLETHLQDCLPRWKSISDRLLALEVEKQNVRPPEKPKEQPDPAASWTVTRQRAEQGEFSNAR